METDLCLAPEDWNSKSYKIDMLRVLILIEGLSADLLQADGQGRKIKMEEDR